MLVSLNWVKDFVELPELTPEEFALRFSMYTAEVDEVIRRGEHLGKVRVIEIEGVRPHPNADKLRLVSFDLDDEKHEVVCGAPNVRPGLKVPYAPIGTTLPNGLTLEPKKIRGVTSQGMLCSPVELELGEDHSGILELDEQAESGATMAEILQQQGDVLLEVDNKSLTHRPDLWGHLGIAREFAAIFRTPLNNRFDDSWQTSLEERFSDAPSPVTISVQKESCCLGYYGISLTGVTVEPSPKWMQERLTAVGLRPINNMVDIGNYVMLETGGPLHIFDQNRIAERKIIIESLTEDTTLELLDETQAKLITGDTVVADPNGPLVIGGIMGGMSSGVTDQTTEIFIEAANWDPTAIRKTSTRLGVRTDSSLRFEKSLDSKQVKCTILRALELVLQLCPDAQVQGKLEYDGPNLDEIQEPLLETSQARIAELLGIDPSDERVSVERISEILNTLEFEVSGTGECMQVKVPTFRATRGFEHESDIVEEVGRLIGYDTIESASPLSPIESKSLSPAKQVHRKVQDFLTFQAGCLEVMTYPMVGSELLERCSWFELNEELKVVNPVSQHRDRMRPSLVPSILETIALNQKNYSRFQFFEVGRAYSSDKTGFSSEAAHLAICFFNKEDSSFLQVINAVEKLARCLGVKARIADDKKVKESPLLPRSWKGCHPVEYQTVQAYGQPVGTITTLHPVVLQPWKVKGNASIAVLDLSTFEERGVQDLSSYTPLPRYPTAAFDCTVVAPERTRAGDIIQAVARLKLKEMSDCRVVDVFPLPDQTKSVTLRTTLFDPEQTLPGEVIKDCEDRIVAALEKAGFPLKS